MEKRPVRARLDTFDGAGLQVDVQGSGDVFSGRGLGEKRRETAVVLGLSALYDATIRLGCVSRLGRVDVESGDSR